MAAKLSRLLQGRMGSKTTHIIGFAIMLAALALTTSVAWAHGVPDQVNDPPTDTGVNCGGGLGTGNVYQSFTPTADELAAVDLRLLMFGTFPAEGASTSIRIREGSPTGPILGSASTFVPGPIANLGQVIAHFDFDPALPLTPGNAYLIEWFAAFTAPADWLFLWSFSETNPYPGGTLYNCWAEANLTWDSNFITYEAQSPPVANDDAYNTNEDTPLVVAAPGVLGNDTDADGDSLSALLVSGPANGTVALNGNGSFIYTPNANFNGLDSFTYKANDGIADSNVATVRIEVAPVNDAPVASDDSYTTTENTALVVAAPGVLGNDADVDGDGLCATWESGHPVDMNCDGSFTYTPDAGFSGTDTFTYRACDSGPLCDAALVTITVVAGGPGGGPPGGGIPGEVVPDNPGSAGGHSNPHACEDNPGYADEHRPRNIPPCRGS